jgi:hypothetical protein
MTVANLFWLEILEIAAGTDRRAEAVKFGSGWDVDG